MTTTVTRLTLVSLLLAGACAGSSGPGSGTGARGGGAAAGTGGAVAGTGGSGASGGSPTAGTGGGAVTPDTAPAGNCVLPTNVTTYTSPNYATNAAVELRIREVVNDFMLPMRTAGADITTRPSAAEIRMTFDQGTPSLRSITVPYQAGRFDELFTLFAASAGNMYRPTEPPPATGGQLGINIYSKEGLDIRQAIEKTMFAATFYYYATTLMKGTVTPATIDRIIAIYGSHPSFGTNDAVASNMDIWGSIYVRRRSNPRAPAPGGFYTQIRDNFIIAQAAAGGGPACAAALQTALRNIRENWEKGLLATSLNYANDTKDKLAQLMVEPSLHGLGEGAGFARGFLMIPAADRRITDAQLEEILGLYGQPSSGPVTVYKFVTESAQQMPKLDQIVLRIKAAYGFSDAEVESFKMTFGGAG